MHYEKFQPVIVKILTGNLLADLVGKFVVLRMLVTQQNETAGSVSVGNEYFWLISEYWVLRFASEWVVRWRLDHLFGHWPILYQFTHSRSFVITLKKMIVNDEWQVLTTIILMLTCQCHEIINQKNQFVAWIEAGTTRNRTHSLTLRQSSRVAIFTLFCVNYYELQVGYSKMESSHYFSFFFCDITPSTSMLTFSSCSKLLWCYSWGKFGYTSFYSLMGTVELCVILGKYKVSGREIAFKIKEVVHDKMLQPIK